MFINSLAPGRFKRNFSKVIFQLILVIDGWSISSKLVLKWIPIHFTDGKSTLVQVMAGCRQAPSHYLSQCWPRSLSPYGVTRPQWVKTWLLLHYNTRSTQKSPVRQQNAWFDTKKPGSTQKCPVRHKNALPSMHQLTLPLSNIPPPLLWEFFFSNFIPIFCF